MRGPGPGQPCLIYIGSDLVITGKIDRRSIPIDARNHQVTLSGRGITRNLVDCSTDLLNDPGIRGGQINGANALDVATKLCKAYGITARSVVADLGIAIPSFQVPLGETPYQIIESVARYAGYLVYEDVSGSLVLDRIGTSQHASGFTLPGNVEAINGERSVDGRFSTYVVIYSGVDQTADLGGLANRRATILDDTLGEYRLRIIVSEQIAPTPAGQQTIDNDANAGDRTGGADLARPEAHLRRLRRVAQAWALEAIGTCAAPPSGRNGAIEPRSSALSKIGRMPSPSRRRRSATLANASSRVSPSAAQPSRQPGAARPARIVSGVSALGPRSDRHRAEIDMIADRERGRDPTARGR